MPFMKPTNPRRITRFQRALDRYGTEDVTRGCLINLLADACHWRDYNDELFAELDRIVHGHYLTEISEESIIS